MYFVTVLKECFSNIGVNQMGNSWKFGRRGGGVPVNKHPWFLDIHIKIPQGQTMFIETQKYKKCEQFQDFSFGTPPIAHQV